MALAWYVRGRGREPAEAIGWIKSMRSVVEPGVQFYTAGYLDGSLEGRGGAKYHKFAGFCLETQHFPDAVNQPEFVRSTLSAVLAIIC